MSQAYRTHEQWRELIAEFEQSELSQKDFCEPRGINLAYFSQRRMELQFDKLKVLYWDKPGFCLWYKRLEKANFKWPRKMPGQTITL